MEGEWALVDPAFEGSDALRPFNWQFDDSFAEIPRRRGALQVSYRGRGRPVFAAQITKLPVGDYYFRAVLDALPSEGVGDFVWVINCLTSEDLPLEVSIFDPAMIEQETGIAFEIPQACDYQELSFRGFPGQFTRQLSFQVNDIEIISARAQP